MILFMQSFLKTKRFATTQLAVLCLIMFSVISCNPLKGENISAEKIENHFMDHYGMYLPDDVKVKAVIGNKSKVRGFNKGNYKITFSGGQTQEYPFLVSRDGRYLIPGGDEGLKLNGETMKETDAYGMREGSLALEGGPPIPILVSGDLRRIIVGKLEDLDNTPATEAASIISLENTPSKGEQTASVNVVEYSDFQCSYCAMAADAISPLLEEYEGKIKFFYKHFPLENIHPWAKEAAVASVCVYDQSNEKFWKFHDSIFQAQQDITVENATQTLSEIAKGMDLDMEQYAKCVKSEQTTMRVEADIKEGKLIGVSGTPAFFVDGFASKGGVDIDALRKIIDRRLSRLSEKSTK